MDVDTYIAQYRSNWTRLEGLCANARRGRALPREDLEQLVPLYLQVSANLTEVRARYHDPGLERYLNGLVGRAHLVVYSARPRSVRGLARFFGAPYREQIRQTASFIGVCAALLLAVIGIGTAWISQTPQYRAGLDVPTAREFVSRFVGDPGSSSILIVFNNVRVAFAAFALGITLGVGSLAVIVATGVMIAQYAGAFHAMGRDAALWATILPHGALELTAICISAGAGLRMGWALIDPGDRPRGAALREEAKGAVVVVLGVIPAFALAAFIEGFVTASVIPDPVEVAIGIGVTVLYVAFLFGARPWRRATASPPT